MASQITKAVVIALEDSPRIKGFLASDWGVSFEVFPAVDTRQGDFLESFNAEEFTQRYGRSPRSGEVGCVMSHFSIIEKFAAEEGQDSDLILIAEDDARPTHDFRFSLTQLLDGPASWDLALLSEPIYGSEKTLKYYALSPRARRIGNGHRFGHFYDKIAGAGLYLMSRAACRVYVTNARKMNGISWVADDFGFFKDTAPLPNPFEGLDIRVVRPGLADWEGETSIQEPTEYATYAQRKLEKMRLPRISELPSRIFALIRNR